MVFFYFVFFPLRLYDGNHSFFLVSTCSNCLWKSPLAFKERLFNTIHWIQTCKLWCVFPNIFHSFLMCEMCVENWFSFIKFSILKDSFVQLHKYFMSFQYMCPQFESINSFFDNMLKMFGVYIFSLWIHIKHFISRECCLGICEKFFWKLEFPFR